MFLGFKSLNIDANANKFSDYDSVVLELTEGYEHEVPLTFLNRIQGDWQPALGP